MRKFTHIYRYMYVYMYMYKEQLNSNTQIRKKEHSFSSLSCSVTTYKESCITVECRKQINLQGLIIGKQRKKKELISVHCILAARDVRSSHTSPTTVYTDSWQASAMA
jgi:hypothetical protein